MKSGSFSRRGMVACLALGMLVAGSALAHQGRGRGGGGGGDRVRRDLRLLPTADGARAGLKGKVRLEAIGSRPGEV